ncbi:MAG: VCBS repeat-containing protein [Caldilineaceae bacterium]|nr:VCBS repeat-containing protein [Caldilineaceae bacterium]MBP8121247.1 VCBS repeat-containing protein [Caldilineaceae bacterium]
MGDSRSVAWGDMDGDGDLDLAVGMRGSNRVYLNVDGRLQVYAAWSSIEEEDTRSVAWGDMDGDGYLDLAVGNFGTPNRVYLNEGGTLQRKAGWFSQEEDSTNSVAWGDMDGDGNLDLAVGNGRADTWGDAKREPNRVYLNEGKHLQEWPAWQSKEMEEDDTYSVAWGDMDGDGTLDLAVGNIGQQKNRVYLNEGNRLQDQAMWSSYEEDYTQSVAWGDVNGDGKLDLAVGNRIYQKDRVYLNEGKLLQTQAMWSLESGTNTMSVAWGDVDGDGDLDLAVGTNAHSNFLDEGKAQSNLVYLNDGKRLQEQATWQSDEEDLTWSVAWGDADGDGDLDLAVGNSRNNYRVYINNGGGLQTQMPWSPVEDRTKSVAWGDMDSDGKLDLAVGNEGQPNRVYLNEGHSLQEQAARSSTEISATQSVAWGDVDDDGDLDLAVGNAGQTNQVYLNVDGSLQEQAEWSSLENDATQSVAWGDVDGDGDMDLAVGNSKHLGATGTDSEGEPNRIYLNEGKRLREQAVWSSAEADITYSVAWGDVDNDGDLDLAVGNQGQPNRVYLNEGGSLQIHATWSSVEEDGTRSVAWGDVDDDGDMDLAVGNYLLEPNRVYLNEGGRLQVQAAWSSWEEDATQSVAWGDVDGDGDLDLAVGNSEELGARGADLAGEPNRVYLNDGTRLREQAVWSSAEADTTHSVAWGDVNGDGILDLATGNYGLPAGMGESNQVYLGSRPAHLLSGGMSSEIMVLHTSDYALPLVRSGMIPITYTLYHPIAEPMRSVKAMFSLDGGGHWLQAKPSTDTITTDLATLSFPQTTMTNTHVFTWDVNASGFFGQSDNVVVRLVAYPNLKPRKNGIPGPFQRPFISTQTLPFRVRGNQVRVVEKGDGLANAVVYWAEADNRDAEPIYLRPGEVAQTAPTGYIPGRGKLAISDTLAALWPTAIVSATTPTRSYLSHTAPISVTKGTTVTAQLILTETRRIGDLSLLLGITHTQGANLFVTLTSPGLTSTPLITGTQAFAETYLSLTLPVDTVRSEIAGGDWTLKIENRGTEEAVLDGWGLEARLSNLYYTSAAPSPTGLKMVEVQKGGVQTLTVSAANPLYLFDLDVALEWDARNDPQYLSQLAIDLRRASEYLFDWTNGGLALGKIRVFHDAKAAVGQYEGDPWLDSHIRIYATNRLRPSAAQGGIVTQVITDSVQKNADAPVVYGPGQVQIGATWNRFGDSGGNLGEDWPRILAHELGHYLLFLDDNYLGINSDPKSPFVGLLEAVTGCSGAMADPYTDDQSGSFKGEFFGVDDVKWIGECEKTLSNQQTGRSDWETILTFYPELAINSQGTRDQNDQNDNLTQVGPSRLPIAVTTVEFVPLAQPADTLDIPIFYLTDDKTKTTAQPGEGSRAFLFTGLDFEGENNWITDLGRPRQDQVLARGAAPGDTLCVFDPAGDRQGCGLVKPNAEGLSLIKTVWQPDVTITPLGTNQITVTVTAIPSGVHLLKARIYPTDLPASQVLSLTVTTRLTATTVFSLEAPAASGYVHVWIADDPHEPYPDSVITDFSVGGNPGEGAENNGYAFARARVGFAFARARVGFAFARARVGFAYTKARYAPAVSTDGQVILFKQGDFPEGQFVTIQSVLNVPKLPEWATLVGHAYRLVVSSQDLALSDTITDTVISFGYLGNEVPTGEELWLKIYHLEDRCVGDASDIDCWTPLETALDMAQNQASAKVDGPGIYAMFSTVEIVLEDGWNLIGYPVQGTRLVTEVLASIAGDYSVVYGFDENDSEDPWNVYIPGAESWASDLETMRFGQGYLIYIDKKGEDGVVLRIKGNTQETQTLTTSVSSRYLTNPPAIYFGTVTSQVPGFTVTSGMTVTVYVDEVPCGQGTIEGDDSSFVVKVRVATEQEANCSAPNHLVDSGVVVYPAAEQQSRLDWDATTPDSETLAVQDESSVGLDSPVEPQPSKPILQVATPVSCQEIVRNGNFDTGDGWAFSLTPSQARIEDLGEGQRVLFLGVGPQAPAPRGLAYSTAYQDILIPYRIASATMTFDYRTDGQTGSQGRFLQIRGLDQSVKMTEHLTGQADLDTSQSYDLTPFRGTWVRLFFQVTNDGRTAPRWMRVDNVSLQVCE